jgi:hypothetical protein
LRIDDVSEIDGIPVTAAVRTAFDLGRRLSRTEAVCAVGAMCHRRVSVELIRFAEDRPAWPGMRRLRETLDLTEPLADRSTGTPQWPAIHMTALTLHWNTR